MVKIAITAVVTAVAGIVGYFLSDSFRERLAQRQRDKIAEEVAVTVDPGRTLGPIKPMNAVKCWERMRAMNRQCDLHTLATRGHCFQFNGQPGTGSFTWMNQLWDFLSRKGLNK